MFSPTCTLVLKLHVFGLSGDDESSNTSAGKKRKEKKKMSWNAHIICLHQSGPELLPYSDSNNLADTDFFFLVSFEKYFMVL